MSTDDTNSWAAWHLHVSALGAPATDRVVRHVVGPAVDAVRGSGGATAWFFLRYWQFGPHVRFRVANLDAEHEREVDSLLRVRMAEVVAACGDPLTAEGYRRHAAPLAAAGEGGRSLDPGELWPAGVYRQRYHPEVMRYGGTDLLPLSEALFQEASELALAFLRLGPPDTARSGLGLRATRAALDALADDGERLRFCRRAATGWQAWAQRGGWGGNPAPRHPGRLESRAPAPVRRWSDHLSQAMTCWLAATTKQEADRILLSHIHMVHNRLGLSVAQEQNHYLALAGSLADGEAARAVAR